MSTETSLSTAGTLRKQNLRLVPYSITILMTQHVRVTGCENQGSFPPPPTPKTGRVSILMGKRWQLRKSINKAQAGGKVAGIFGDSEERAQWVRGSGKLVIKLERQFGGGRVLNVNKRNLGFT